MISVFTPTHDPKHLNDCYESLLAQYYADWEWVVVLHGPIPNNRLPSTGNDSRVRVVPAPAGLNTIGALKRFAASICTGELLVELDHDDMLTPPCLAKLYGEYKRSNSGFIYSDCLGLYENDTVETYSTEYGWEYGSHTYNDKTYQTMQSFEPSARSLAEIYYAPNHVRCWARCTYQDIGGHDPDLAVCDDHDLLCRTYISPAKMVRIPEVLYHQRRHLEATSIKWWEQIGAMTAKIRNKYLFDLVVSWCKREGKPLVCLGHINNDKVDDYWETIPTGIGEYHALPYGNSGVGVLLVPDYLQRLTPQQAVSFLNEAYRVLVPGGWLLTATTAISDDDGRVGRGAWQDPNHQSFWSANNTWYFTDRNYAKFVPEIKCRFQTVRLDTLYPSDWHRANQIPYLMWDCCAIKDGCRLPGLKHI